MAFDTLIEPHRLALQAHCYRMLRSPHDAEDALQTTLLRAWRGLPRFERGSSARAWLYRIATNVCLDAISRRPRRALPVAPSIEPRPEETVGNAALDVAPDTHYEQREALELAFVGVLRHLTARQHAALILRDALGFSAKETADALGTTTASVNSALARARRGADRRLPHAGREAARGADGDRRLRERAERLVDAFEHGDVDAIERLVTSGAA